MEKRAKAREAIEAMRQQSEQNGNSELTLEEINEEIRQSRIDRKTKSIFHNHLLW